MKHHWSDDVWLLSPAVRATLGALCIAVSVLMICAVLYWTPSGLPPIALVAISVSFFFLIPGLLVMGRWLLNSARDD